MMGLGKHINRLNCCNRETLPAEIAEIPAERCRVAGDIDQPFLADPANTFG